MPPPKYQHPIDIEEGTLERLIKNIAKRSGNLLDRDMPYLEQYLHPDRDILEKQPLRPTINLDPNNKYEYRKPALTEDGGPNITGLGRYVNSISPNYNSIYDKWDFNTDAPLAGLSNGSIFRSPMDGLAKSILKRAGTPFNVYERYPKTDEQREVERILAEDDKPVGIGPSKKVKK